MTAKELFEGLLMEKKKEESPHFHLREFNYYANEVIYEWIDGIVLAFQNEKNQNVLDVIKSIKRYNEFTAFTPSLKGNFKFTLPPDYRHLSNLIVFYKVLEPIVDKCYPVSDTLIDFKALQMSPNLEASTKQDSFTRPRYFRPYYSIVGNECEIHTDFNVNINGSGALDLVKVRMDYIKTPVSINLTYDQAYNDVTDRSQVLEFDELTCRHIRKLLVQRVMERDSDPRLQTHIPITGLKRTPDLVSADVRNT